MPTDDNEREAYERYFDAADKVPGRVPMTFDEWKAKVKPGAHDQRIREIVGKLKRDGLWDLMEIVVMQFQGRQQNLKNVKEFR